MESEEDASVEATSSSNNIRSDEIDEETAKKLRGAAIGDTLYSEVFVLNTLLQFSNSKWDSDLEDNLCILWDMTEEKDVCQYLFKSSYPSLACSAITGPNEPRFIEIVVGIFANLLCAECPKAVQVEEVKTVLTLLSSNDPYILIQVMRFVHAVSFLFDKLDFVDESHGDMIHFILCNSTNKELLVLSLKTLAAMTDSTKLNSNLIKRDLLVAAITAYKTIKTSFVNASDFEIFEFQEHHSNVKHLIQLFCNVCCYIDQLNLDKGDFQSCLRDFTEEINVLLNFYVLEETLLPINEDLKFYIEALCYIYRILSQPYTSETVLLLSKITYIVTVKDPDSLEMIAELLCYFISVGTVESVKSDFCKMPVQYAKSLLTALDRQFSYDFEYLTNLRNVKSTF